MNIKLPPKITPQYKNLFLARLYPPDTLGIDSTDIENNYMLIRSTKIPGINHDRVSDNFLTLQYHFRDNKVKFNTIEFTFLLTMDNTSMFYYAQTWTNAILGHFINDQTHFALGKQPDEYKGQVAIMLLDATFSPIYVIGLSGAFPMSISDLDVSYDGGAELMTFSMTFSFDFPNLITPSLS